MSGKPSVASRTAKQLQEIMLGFLQTGGRIADWPGGDALTIEDILDSYAEAVARGEVPDWRQLLCRHPELGTELYLWLAAKDRWKFAFRGDPFGRT